MNTPAPVIEKLASDAQLSPEACRNIATYSFVSALTSPAVGMPMALAKSAGAKFAEGIAHFENRHAKLVDMLTEHVKTPASV